VSVRFLRPGDVVLAVLLLAGSVAVLLFGRQPRAAGSCEVRTVAGVVHIRLPADTTLTVGGPVGETRIEIRGLAVRVVESDCPGRLCVRAGAISSPGQAIACLPNRVVVRLTGDSLDAVTR
jgi:hypothetical protein